MGGGGGGGLFSENMVAVNRKNKAIEELVQGKEFAGRLQVLLLQKPFGGDGSSSSSSAAEELAGKILRSFTETLSVLGGGGGETTSSAGEVVEEEGDSLVSGGRRSEESGESKKRSMSPKGRRGCYKRKKTSETWRMMTPTFEDGHAWRKYGQKDILNTKYPRSYFRCTHKYEQGCKATKQVQKTEDNPLMYETIYIGKHTCRSHMSLTSTAPQMIITDINGGPWRSSSSVISSPSSSTAVVVVKQEYNLKEEISNGGGDDDLSENLSSSHHHGDHHEQQMEYFSMWDDLDPLDHYHHQHHHQASITTTTCHQENFHIDFDSELCFDESDLFLSC